MKRLLSTILFSVVIAIGMTAVLHSAQAQQPSAAGNAPGVPHASASGSNQAQPQPSSTNKDTEAKIEKSQIEEGVIPSPTPKKGYRYMYAIFETSIGKFKCKLFYEFAPKTVDNFVGLTEGTKEWKDPITFENRKSHFYDGLTFHRIIPKFMIQGGDPQGNGMGGPGYEFSDEKTPNLNFDKAGMLAMANRGSNTNGSQFFITTDPVSFLNDKPGQHYTIFGEVVEGMDVVKKISQVPTDKTNDRPLKPVKIIKVTIQRK